MANRALERTTPRSRHNYGGVLVPVGRNYVRISQLEEERIRRENFEKGCKWAAIALGLTFGPMFALGAWFGW